MRNLEFSTSSEDWVYVYMANQKLSRIDIGNFLPQYHTDWAHMGEIHRTTVSCISPEKGPGLIGTLRKPPTLPMRTNGICPSQNGEIPRLYERDMINSSIRPIVVVGYGSVFRLAPLLFFVKKGKFAFAD